MLKMLLFSNGVWAKDFGILLIRLGLGAIFIKHGYGKLLGGHSSWLWLGKQMALIGITGWPVFWGFCAMLAEFVGGSLVLVGLFMRPAALSIACVMFLAVIHHLHQHDSFGVLSHPLSLLFVFIGLMFMGAGRYSLDYYLR